MMLYMPDDLQVNIIYSKRKTIAIELHMDKILMHAPMVGVDYGRITIRNQRSRWGSCSAKGNLNFNCLLILFPGDVIDYVVVHELCHRKHMNHSAEFYAEVECVFPQYRRCKKWLRENGSLYLNRVM
ncbi:MAG: M48 family metallopeptidase [Catenibacillus sp.]|nr:M48 family metallopeptidase [Catenibacillus sp.]